MGSWADRRAGGKTKWILGQGDGRVGRVDTGRHRMDTTGWTSRHPGTPGTLGDIKEDQTIVLYWTGHQVTEISRDRGQIKKHRQTDM